MRTQQRAPGPLGLHTIAGLLAVCLVTLPTAAAADTSVDEGSVATVQAAAEAPASPLPVVFSASEMGYPYAGSGDFVLADPTDGLDALEAYRATLVVSFEGSVEEGGRQWTSTIALEHAREPSVDIATARNEGDVDSADPALEAEVGGISYAVWSDLGCVARPLDPASPIRRRLEPAGRLSGIIGAVAAGQDDIDGVAADRYVFDEAALGLAGIAEGEGTVWVASDGGYVVRYELSLSGDAMPLAGGLPGTMSFEYELQPGHDIATSAPAGCGTETLSVPLPPDATEVVHGATFLEFQTPSSLEGVVSYYTKAGRKAGWKPLDSPVMVGDTAVLESKMKGKRITILATRGDGFTTVMISAPGDA